MFVQKMTFLQLANWDTQKAPPPLNRETVNKVRLMIPRPPQSILSPDDDGGAEGGGEV